MAYSDAGLGSRPGRDPRFPPIPPPSQLDPEHPPSWIPVLVCLSVLSFLTLVSLEAFLYSRWPYSLLTSRWSLRLPRFRKSLSLTDDASVKNLDHTQSDLIDEEAYDNTCAPNRLCDPCSSAVRKSGLIFGTFWIVTPKVEKWDLYASLHDLRRSSMAFCHLCGIIWHAIPLGMKKRIQSEDELLKAQAQNSGQEGTRIRLVIVEEMSSSRTLFDWAKANRLWMQVYREDEPISSRLEIKTVDTDSYEIASQSEAECHPWSTTADTEHHLSLAKAWIQLCISNHDICQSNRVPETPFPTRLVYVGGQDGCDNVHLVLTSPEDYGRPYAALSHCWGGANIFTLNSRTESSMLDSIPWNSLAKNFQDAITITRRLGLSYVWIDSLCILQDSIDDWNHESAIMGSIYTHAYVTIASTGSADSSGGFFHTRNPLGFHPCTIAASQAQHLVVTPISQSEVFDEIEESPLNQRAWVFQERLLSPRILHFGQHLLFWECNVVTASEINTTGTTYRQMRNRVTRIRPQYDIQREREPDRICISYGKADEQTWLLEETEGSQAAQIKPMTQPPSMEDHWSKLSSSRQHTRLNGWPGYRGAFGTLTKYTTPNAASYDAPDISRFFGFHQRWFELVRLYSNGKLTRSSDKLIAMAGIARAVQQTRGLTYLAGLWKECLLLDLLWYVEYPENSRPDPYRAPSWSWASVDGQIMHKVDPCRKHVYRSILEGQALIEEAKVTSGGSNTSDPVSLIDGGFLQAKGSVCSVFTVEKFSKRLVLLDENRNFIAWFIPDILMRQPYPQLFCLKIATFKTKQAPLIEDLLNGLGFPAPKTESQGLVLKMRGKDTYERVGFFSTDVSGFSVRLVFDPFTHCPIKSIVVF